MTETRVVKSKKIIMGKLSYGCDLLEELTKVCSDNEIKLGKISAIGAVQKSCIGYYNQIKREYRFINSEKHSEILNLTGNVSIKDDKPFVHAHVTLADEAGNAHGGHLASGTTVFACEFIIQPFDGSDFIRGIDEKTGLPLWEI